MIPLFPVSNEQEAAEIFRAQINRLIRQDGYLFDEALTGKGPDAALDFLKALIGKTGAQTERLLRRAKRLAVTAPVSCDHIHRVLDADREFEAEPQAYELQRLIAILEAIETENDDLIPPYYRREVDEKYQGVTGARRRMEELRASVDFG